MKNKFAAVSLGLILSLTTCHSSIAVADEIQDTQLNNETASSIYEEIFVVDDTLTMLQEEALARELAKQKALDYQEMLEANTTRMTKTVSKLKKQLWSNYGRGGSSPGYWDCSGLVRWFYGQLGVDIRHSATAQSHLGKKVNTPKIGDIVAFHYGSERYSFHTGIYVGDGKVLHAYNNVSDTLISDVKDIANENGAWVTYRRLIETN